MACARYMLCIASLLPGWSEDGFLTQPFDAKNVECKNFRL